VSDKKERNARGRGIGIGFAEDAGSDVGVVETGGEDEGVEAVADGIEG
jgi:hypothetical protein